MTLYILNPDKKNTLIKIVDLNESIALAKSFKNFGDDNNVFQAKIRKYWNDIYIQLKSLEKTLERVDNPLTKAVYNSCFVEKLKNNEFLNDYPSFEQDLKFFLRSLTPFELLMISVELDIDYNNQEDLFKKLNQIIKTK